MRSGNGLQPDAFGNKLLNRENIPAEYVTRKEFNDFKEASKLLISKIIESLHNF